MLSNVTFDTLIAIEHAQHLLTEQGKLELAALYAKAARGKERDKNWRWIAAHLGLGKRVAKSAKIGNR